MNANDFAAKGYESVRDSFSHAADTGGGQLCVYRRGQQVVDLWAGRDTVNGRPYGQKTP